MSLSVVHNLKLSFRHFSTRATATTASSFYKPKRSTRFIPTLANTNTNTITTTKTNYFNHHQIRHQNTTPPNNQIMNELIQKHAPLAEKACTYLTSSPDPYHAVANSINKLEASGYVQLRKRDPFEGKIKPGGKYYYTLNKTTLVAFAVGEKYLPGNGFKIIGGHTDSPNLKVKPISRRTGSGCTQLAVECYGGGLWHTWLDRDLGISGRVLVREPSTTGGLGITQRFVKVDRPVARVSTLAIHLQSAEERGALKINKEEHLQPILGTQEILENGVKDQLTGNTNNDGEEEKVDFWTKKQEPVLLDLIASELNIEVKDIADFELNLFDTQPASLGGVASEFIYSARLDNLATCFVAVEGLIAHSNDEGLMAEDSDVNLVVLFDHEEIGSSSAQGAASPVLADAVKRITYAFTPPSSPYYNRSDLLSTSIRKSFFLSVDQAHAVHPNYPSKHEKNHGPKLNKGIVVKTNQNQRYATNGVTGFFIREMVRKAGLVETQDFVVRNDCGCGSTIGPTVSAATGIRTVDVGMPQLSMHSCREVMGIVDLTNGLDMFKAFFKHFREIDDCLEG